MAPTGRLLMSQVTLVVVIAAAFVGAELLRASDPFRGTALSMVGWSAFVVLFLWWLWEDCGIGVGLRELVRVVVLTSVACAVLYLYYRHSGLLAAGIEVDAGYTFVGLQWFVGFDNPITYAGRTTSFAQFPLALMTHLPGYLVGFDRLGPFAIHVGIMLQVGLLLALLTAWLVERGMLVQIPIAALAAAVFSNRLTLLLNNLTGYAIPAVTVGAMCLALTLGDRTPSTVRRRIGGLLVLALLHHYPGVFFVLSLVGVWVVAGRAPVRRVGRFLRANVPLWAVVVIAVICVTLRPELLLPRLRAVTTPSLSTDELMTKVTSNWTYLTSAFPFAFVDIFFRKSPGSWHLLDVAPLGGPLPQVICANWVVTALALGRRGVVYLGALVLLALGLVVLTGLQHLVTGFENYRDMMLVIGLATTSIGFVFLIPRAGRLARVAIAGWALGVAAFNYHDVAALSGRRYGVGEYAPEAQAATDAIRRFWRHDDERLRGATLWVVVKKPFPLEPLYRDASRAHAIDLRFVDSVAFCRLPAFSVAGALANTCGPVGFVLPADVCPEQWRPRLGWPPSRESDGSALYLFETACGRTEERDLKAPEMIDLAQ